MNRQVLRNEALALLFPLGIALFLFYEALAPTKVFFFRDVFLYHYPIRKVIQAAWDSGSIPFWNPGLGFGQPLLANPDYAIFYPTSLVYFVLPFGIAFKWHFLLHFFLAPISFYFLLRHLKVGRLAASLGCSLYLVSGIFLSTGNVYSLVVGATLAPLLLWLVLRWVDRPTIRTGMAVAIVFALQFLALELTVAVGNTLATFVLVVLEARGCRQRRLLSLAGFLAVAVGLAALQVLPAAELFTQSARRTGFSFEVASNLSAHPVQLLEFIYPFLLGDSTKLVDTFLAFKISRGNLPYVVSLYIGPAAVVLFIFGLVFCRTPRMWFFAIMASISILLSLGEHLPVYRWLYDWVPLFSSMRFPSKWLLFANMGIIVVGSMGVDQLFDRSRAFETSGWRRRLFWAMELFLVLLPAFGGQRFVDWIDLTLTGSMGAFLRTTGPQLDVALGRLQLKFVQTFILTLGACLTLLLMFNRKNRPHSSAIFGLLAALVLLPPLAVNYNVNPKANDDFYYTPATAAFLKSQRTSLEPLRIISHADAGDKPPDLEFWGYNDSRLWACTWAHDSLLPNVGIEHNFSYAFDPDLGDSFLADYPTFYAAFNIQPPEVRRKWLNLVGARHIVALSEHPVKSWRPVFSVRSNSNYPTRLYENRDALPIAYFVDRARYFDDREDLLEYISSDGFVPGSEVLFEGAGPSTSSPGPLSNGGEVVPVWIAAYSPGEVVLDVETTRPGYVVLSDTFSPNWKVSVDGDAAPVLRANYCFRAVAVGSGKHRVIFRYSSPAFYLGLTISLVTWLGVGTVLIGSRKL